MTQESTAFSDRSIPAILKNLTVYAGVYSHVFHLASSKKI